MVLSLAFRIDVKHLAFLDDTGLMHKSWRYQSCDLLIGFLQHHAHSASFVSNSLSQFVSIAQGVGGQVIIAGFSRA